MRRPNRPGRDSRWHSRCELSSGGPSGPGAGSSAVLARWAGLAAPVSGRDRLIGLHLSGTNPYAGQVPDDLSPEEARIVERAQGWMQWEMAYAMLHSSKPDTVAVALNDSPAGLAAWVLKKLHASHLRRARKNRCPWPFLAEGETPGSNLLQRNGGFLRITVVGRNLGIFPAAEQW